MNYKNKELTHLHKKTKQKLLLKKRGTSVSTFYLLDDNYNKIKQKKPIGKGIWLDIYGNIVYRVVICKNKNVVNETKTN